MIEGSWVLDALDKFLPILDMNSIIFHFRMEDVLQAMLSHKFVRKNSNTLFDFMVKVVAAPHFPQALYGVDFLLDPPYLHHELWEGDSQTGLVDKTFGFWWLLNKSQDRLSIVFRNVLGVVPHAWVVADFITGLPLFTHRFIVKRINFWLTLRIIRVALRFLDEFSFLGLWLRKTDRYNGSWMLFLLVHRCHKHMIYW